MPRANDDLRQAIGAFKRQCPECERWFFTDDVRIVYDTDACKKRAANRRNYERHATERSARNAARQKAQRDKLRRYENDSPLAEPDLNASDTPR